MKHKIAVNILSLYLVEPYEKILFAPLNWGLGHATRIVPLIKKELQNKNHVLITANGSANNYLRQEFPHVEFVKTPEFKIRYSKNSFFVFALLLQMPLFFLSFYRDWYALKRLIRKYKINKVVSDNRYGFYNKNIESILITHQLFIKLPKAIKFCEPILHFLTSRLISKFNECWVPDYADINKSLSGTLSHGKPVLKNVKFIGPLSRFSSFEEQVSDVKHYDVLALISGPEPQRTLFEKSLAERLKNTNEEVLFICGKPWQNSTEKDGNITKLPHASTAQIANYLKHAKHVIARSGYSTIMDLHVLGVKAELIPTKKQTEQEYLAEWNQKRKFEAIQET